MLLLQVGNIHLEILLKLVPYMPTVSLSQVGIW